METKCLFEVSSSIGFQFEFEKQQFELEKEKLRGTMMEKIYNTLYVLGEHSLVLFNLRKHLNLHFYSPFKVALWNDEIADFYITILPTQIGSGPTDISRHLIITSILVSSRKISTQKSGG